MSDISVTAIIAARNELMYLKNLLPYLCQQNVEVVLIDNDSDDGTQDLINAQSYSNITKVVCAPYAGNFDLGQILAIKDDVVKELKSDWIVHHDADEVLQSLSGTSLKEAIADADDLSCNCINFNELVMLPADPECEDYLSNSKNYYFFEPAKIRLQRAWRRKSGINNVQGAGHRLAGGEMRMYPEAMLLKHFIVRSQQHAYDKYLTREFSREDLKKNWHGNRLNLTKDMLRIPIQSERLHSLKCPSAAPASLPAPERKHFWHW